MQVPIRKKPISVLVILLLSGLLPACEKGNQYVAPPPPPVTIAQPLEREVIDYLDFTGTTQAIASVDIRARVPGFLQTIHFKAGDDVKKGDLLFVIEPNIYQAAVDKAVADLAGQKAQLERAEVEYQRNQRLYKENATSERELVNSKATRDSAKSSVSMAEAALENARINLGYTTIRAPLSGRIGRNLVDVGNLVGAGEFTLLATIKQYDPIYAYFTLNERQLLRIMKSARKKTPNRYDPEDVVLGMALSNETNYPHQGHLDFVDLGVDQATGTILMRGEFPNPEPTSILPGLFVRLRLPIEKHNHALLVTERALGADQLGNYLLVVNKENVVEYRSVQQGTLVDGMRVIDEGLKADDWVVVDGIQRTRPGAKVNPTKAGRDVQANGGKPSGEEAPPPAPAPPKP